MIGVLVTEELGRHDELRKILAQLEPFRGEHAAGSGVAYMGPVELALGIGYAALGETAKATADLEEAERQAERAGAPTYAKEARTRLKELTPMPLSPRELEVAKLIAKGLTNKQIAQDLYLSERTAQNHVQHILTKLGFATRSQIAVWMSTSMSTPADGLPRRSS
jgi:DNA-binding NarL/FixJ family response regulator